MAIIKLYRAIAPELLNEEQQTKFGKIFAKILKEYAEKSYNLSQILDFQYKKVFNVIKALYSGKDVLSSTNYTSPYNNLKGKYIKVDDVYYVFLKKGELGPMAAFGTESEDPNNVIYCAVLNNNEIDDDTFLSFLSGKHEAALKHELTHIYDKKRYTGNEPHLEVNNENDKIKYYNHGLEMNSHNSEIRAKIINYLDKKVTDYSDKTRQDMMNSLMKQFSEIRKNIYTGNLFDYTLVQYIQYLSEDNYKTLLKHMFEFIYYYFEQKIKGEDVKTNP